MSDKNTASLALKILAAEDGAPPTEFRIFNAGKVRTTKGDFLFDEDAAQAVLKAHADYGNDMCIDYAHAMFSYSAPQDQVAAGWFDIELRDGALWAVNVEWTPKALQSLKDREWRYMSPTFSHSGDESERRIQQLLNVALTNVPATKKLKPLVASRDDETDNTRSESPGKEETQMKVLLGMLGLAEAATEADAIAALNKREDAVSKINALTGKSTLGESLAMCSAWKEQAGKAAALEAVIASEKKKAEDTAALSAIEKSFDGKLITPAQKDVASKVYADHGAAALSAFLSAFTTPVVSTEKLTPKSGETISLLTDEERVVMKKMKLTEEEFLASKRDLALPQEV
jgi:phage I-like protein